jgi:hypothetical protein
MGIGDFFTRLFFGKKDAHFFASDATKKSNVMKVAGELQPILGGNVKEREGGDEVHVTGEYAGLPVRVVFDVNFGGVTVEAKTQKELTHMFINYDPEGRAAYSGDTQNADEWDDENSEIKVFVSEHLYYEGDTEELARWKEIWEGIPEAVRNQIVGALEAIQGSFMMDRQGKIELRTHQSIMGLGGELDRIKGYLDILTQAASSL